MNKVRFLATVKFIHDPNQRDYPCEVLGAASQTVPLVKIYAPSMGDKYFNYFRNVRPEELSNIHMVLVTDAEANSRIDEMLKAGGVA